MNASCLVLVTAILCVSISKVLCGIEEGSFLETDAGIRRIHRNLLQEDEGVDSSNDVSDGESETEMPKEPEVEPPKGLFEKDEDKKGPELFYTGKLPFLMHVDGGVIIHRSGVPTTLGTAQAIDGSNNINGESIVTIDWKEQGRLQMTFNSSKTDFILLGMEYREGGTVSELSAKTSHGYKVEAPRGLAWACDAPGMFKTKGGSIEGITLPNARIQANFDHDRLRGFGPLWYCGEVMPIALWVGLIVSLFFGYVCYWGFSMLASINTMDRFDDPKGKQIYVPQSD